MSVKKYFPDGMEQLQHFGTMLNLKAKAKSTAPELQNVIDLEKIANFIPTVISSHYEDIAGGGAGYYSKVVREDGHGARVWEWQMHVSILGWVDAHDCLFICCRRGLFCTDCVGLRQSHLWVIDCCRGGSRHGAGAWVDD